MKVRHLISVLGIAVLTACSSPQDNSLYYWGNYADIVYAYYNEDGNLAQQEEQLNQLIEQAKERNKTVAPGVYGHLGLILLKQGKQSQAKSAFEEEQRLFPESTRFIQYLQRKK